MKTSYSERNRRIIGLIAKYQRYMNARDEDVAASLKITRECYSRKYKAHPADLKYSQLGAFKDEFKVPDSEWAEAVR